MIRMVLSDFRARKIVAGEKPSEKWWLCFWWGIIGTNLINIAAQLNQNMLKQNMTVKWEVLLANFLVFLVAACIQSLYPTSISKMLFLSPMDKKERMSYLKCAFWLKQWVFCGISLLTNMALIWFHKMFVWEGMLLVLSYFILMLQLGTPENRKPVSNLSKMSEYEKQQRNAWQENIALLGGIAGYMGLMIFCATGKKGEIVAVLAIIIQTLCVPWIVKNLKKRFQEAAELDNMQRIFGE